MTAPHQMGPRLPVQWPAAGESGGFAGGREPGGLWELAYYSAAVRHFDAADLEQLLADARQRNADHDLTGLLLYWDRSFFQILEGRLADIRAVFEGFIQPAGSHRSIFVCHIGEIDRRSFGRWRMAARDVRGESEIEDIRMAIDGIDTRNAAPRDAALQTRSVGRVFLNAFAANLGHY